MHCHHGQNRLNMVKIDLIHCLLEFNAEKQRQNWKHAQGEGEWGLQSVCNALTLLLFPYIPPLLQHVTSPWLQSFGTNLLQHGLSSVCSLLQGISSCYDRVLQRPQHGHLVWPSPQAAWKCLLYSTALIGCGSYLCSPPEAPPSLSSCSQPRCLQDCFSRFRPTPLFLTHCWAAFLPFNYVDLVVPPPVVPCPGSGGASWNQALQSRTTWPPITPHPVQLQKSIKSLLSIRAIF